MIRQPTIDYKTAYPEVEEDKMVISEPPVDQPGLFVFNNQPEPVLSTGLMWVKQQIQELTNTSIKFIDKCVDEFKARCNPFRNRKMLSRPINSAVSIATRTVSSAGNNSYRLLDDSISPYGLNTDQDVGIVEKIGRRISSTTYSYESRPRFMQKEAKNFELIYSALYTFYFKEGRYANDDDYILVFSINDVNIDRPQVTTLHVDGFVPHTFLKKQISEKGVDEGIKQMTDDIMDILRSMGGETPEIVSIKFKTAAQGEDPRIIITTIRDKGQIYTYSTAPAAAGNEMPQVFFKNREVLHGTPAPIDLEFLKEKYMTETGNFLPQDAIDYIIQFNSYMEQAKKHTRHFVRRAANTLFHKNTIPDPETSLKIESVKRDIVRVKTRMMSESAITNINRKITIKNKYVLDDLENNLNENFRNWEEYGNLNVNGENYNLLERLRYQGNDETIKVDVNDETIIWPLDFHLIRFKNIGGLYIPVGSDVNEPNHKKPKLSTPHINPKDLSVYQEYIVDYDDNIKNKIIAMVDSQHSSKITRFSLDNKGCPKKGGRSNRKKQRNTKKKQNKLRKGRRTKQKKHNKRRSRKIR